MVTVYQYGSCTYSIAVICLISCIFFSSSSPSSSSSLSFSSSSFFSFFILATTYNEPTSTARKPAICNCIATYLASPCFPSLARPTRGRALTRCHSPRICAHAQMRTKPSSLVATQLLFCFMMEMLRQNMLEAYFHNIRLTFCY